MPVIPKYQEWGALKGKTSIWYGKLIFEKTMPEKSLITNMLSLGQYGEASV